MLFLPVLGGHLFVHAPPSPHSSGLTVDSTAGKATNLNAGKVDGRDAPMWAVVSSDGSILRQSDAGTLSWQTGGATGFKDIEFPRNVSNCAATATLTQSHNGAISTGSRNIDTPKRVSVYTFDMQGSAEDLPFELVVNC